MIANLNEGDYVNVNGSVVSSGWLYADDVRVSPGAYVPGADSVFFTGVPSAINERAGTAQFGAVSVDLTALSRVGADNLWVVSGTQPNPKGVVVAN